MEAQFKRIRQLFGRPGVQFEVPDYQRGYEWKEKHLQDLWNDLERIGEGVDFHYFGNIILRRKEGGDKFEIVDGQQRMITLSLLMMAIRDSSIIDVEGDRRFDDILYCYKASDRERRIIYENNDEFDNQFDRIWNENSSDTEGNMREAYDYYRKKIDGLSRNTLNELVDKIGANLRVVETTADDTRIAYMIFRHC